MRRNDGNAVWSAFVLEPSLQNSVNSNTCRYGHQTLAPLRQFLFQIRRSSMQHSNLPCHCLTLKKRSYHIIAAGLVSEFQTGNSSFTLQKWSCEVWSWIIELSANCRAIKNSNFFKVNLPASRDTRLRAPNQENELSNHNNFNIRYWSLNYRGCFCDTHLLRGVIKLFELGRLDNQWSTFARLDHNSSRQSFWTRKSGT